MEDLKEELLALAKPLRYRKRSNIFGPIIINSGLVVESQSIIFDNPFPADWAISPNNYGGWIVNYVGTPHRPAQDSQPAEVPNPDP